MALVALVREYLRKMLGNTGGMKALLLDEETTAITGTVLSQTEALQQEVFLIEKLDKQVCLNRFRKFPPFSSLSEENALLALAHALFYFHSSSRNCL